MIERALQKNIIAKLKDRKAIILLGPRQSGKSTFMRLIQPHLKPPINWWNGDETDIRKASSSYFIRG